MWWEDPKYTDDVRAFSDFLQQLIDMGHLEGKTLGITKLVINEGLKNLSEKQKYVFKKNVIDQFTISECKNCGQKLFWLEMYDAAIEHGECSGCVYNELRMNKE